MAKETEKNNKGKKTTTKTNTAKKSSTAKKSTTVKKAATKSTTSKKDVKVEVKNEEPKTVEVKPVVKNETIQKGNECSCKNNTPFIISLCVIVILLAALIYSICSKRIPKLKDGNEIVATIKGKDITANDLFESLKESYGTSALLDIIDTYIANKEVKITDDDKEYANEVVDYYKEMAEYYQVDFITFINNYLGLTDITSEKEFNDFVLEDYKKTLVVKNYLIDNAKEEDLKEYYEANYSDKLTVKHILIEVDPENEDSEAADEEARETAEEIINKLNDTDKDDLDEKFNELARDYSDDTQTYNNGGLMEDLVKANIQESFFNAAYELEDGEYTKETVKTTYGYHVILKVSSKPADKYEDVIDAVKSEYADSLLSLDSSIMTLTWDEIRNKYKLSINDDIIKEAYEKQIESLKGQENETEE